MMDDDVAGKRGIYPYVLTKNEKHLNIRTFTANQKRHIFEKQNGVYMKCGESFRLERMETDRITPWSKGGKTNIENCRMLCQECNRRKSNAWIIPDDGQ